jgi:hypothetical protein
MFATLLLIRFLHTLPSEFQRSPWWKALRPPTWNDPDNGMNDSTMFGSMKITQRSKFSLGKSASTRISDKCLVAIQVKRPNDWWVLEVGGTEMYVPCLVKTLEINTLSPDRTVLKFFSSTSHRRLPIIDSPSSTPHHRISRQNTQFHPPREASRMCCQF